MVDGKLWVRVRRFFSCYHINKLNLLVCCASYILTRLSMPNAVSVGTRQRLWGCQSAVSITCCVAEVSYVASTDRDRNMF